MAIGIKSSRSEMTWLAGRDGRPTRAGVTGSGAKLVLLPLVLLAGLSAWMMQSGPSDADSQPVPAGSPVITSSQNTPWFNPAITPTQAILVAPQNETSPAETTVVQTTPVDGLAILSQSWRRGGLGSKALVTFTLRNRNDYAVKDIEIFCAFARKDGSHLTDRRRTIPDTLDTKSRKTFARMLVGFVNISASQAKCSLVTANRI